MQEKDWIFYDTYMVNIHEQGTDEWLKARKGILTGSNFGAAAGNSPYETLSEYAEIFSGRKTKVFSEFAISNMARGTRLEPYARTLYEKIKGVTVEEIGLAIPYWDKRIGSSVDGLVGLDGCIEIKCPIKIYERLNIQNISQKMRINPTHYDQMQGAMSILNREWCDYVVYCESENRLYIERVWRDNVYWNEDLYPKLVNFLEHHVS